MLLLLSVLASAGLSKSGGELKVSSPELLMLKSAASVPVRDQDSVPPPVAVKVSRIVDAVVAFSCAEMLDAPEITGAVTSVGSSVTLIVTS